MKHLDHTVYNKRQNDQKTSLINKNKLNDNTGKRNIKLYNLCQQTPRRILNVFTSLQQTTINTYMQVTSRNSPPLMVLIPNGTTGIFNCAPIWKLKIGLLRLNTLLGLAPLVSILTSTRKSTTNYTPSAEKVLPLPKSLRQQRTSTAGRRPGSFSTVTKVFQNNANAHFASSSNKFATFIEPKRPNILIGLKGSVAKWPTTIHFHHPPTSKKS